MIEDAFNSQPYAQSSSWQDNIYTFLKTEPPLEETVDRINHTTTDKLILDTIAERIKEVYDCGFDEETANYMTCIGDYYNHNLTEKKFRKKIARLFESDVYYLSERLMPPQRIGYDWLLPLSSTAAFVLIPQFTTNPVVMLATAAYTIGAAVLYCKRRKQRLAPRQPLHSAVDSLRKIVEKTDALALFERNEPYFKEMFEKYRRIIVDR